MCWRSEPSASVGASAVVWSLIGRSCCVIVFGFECVAETKRNRTFANRILAEPMNRSGWLVHRLWYAIGWCLLVFFFAIWSWNESSPVEPCAVWLSVANRSVIRLFVCECARVFCFGFCLREGEPVGRPWFIDRRTEKKERWSEIIRAIELPKKKRTTAVSLSKGRIKKNVVSIWNSIDWNGAWLISPITCHHLATRGESFNSNF